MNYSDVVEYFEVNKEQFNSTLQKCLKHLKSCQNLKGKQISTTYQVLSTIATEILNKGCKEEEYFAGIKCIQFLLNSWNAFVKAVKKNVLGNIIFHFVKHCDFQLNQRTNTTLELYLNYALCDPNYDGNILKWVIKKITYISLAKCICACPSNCTILEYSSLSIYGYVLRTFLYESKPLEFFAFLDTHIHEIVKTKPKCCHHVGFASLIQNQIANSIERFGKLTAHEGEYMKAAAIIYGKILTINGVCTDCSSKNYLEILLELIQHLNAMLKHCDGIENRTAIPTNSLNMLLSALRLSTRSEEIFKEPTNIITFFELIQEFIKFYPTKNNHFCNVTVPSAYLPRIVNNIFSLVVNLYNKHTMTAEICNSIMKLLLDLLNIVASTVIMWESAFATNIKNAIKLLCRVAVVYSIEITDVIAKIVACWSEDFEVSSIVDIHSIWLQKTCEKVSSKNCELLSHVLAEYDLASKVFVKVICLEVNFLAKYGRNAVAKPIQIPSKLQNTELWDENTGHWAITFCYAVYSSPQYFVCTNSQLLKLCAMIHNHLNSELNEDWELLVRSQLLLFMIKWQENVCKDWACSLDKKYSDTKETICMFSGLNEISDICNKKLKDNAELCYVDETIETISALANVLQLHGHLLESATILSNLTEYFLQVEVTEELIQTFVLTSVNCANVFYKLNCLEAVKYYFAISSKFFDKYSTLFEIKTKTKEFVFAKMSVKLLECKCLLLSGNIKETHRHLNTLQKECQNIESMYVKEWFSLQINTLRFLVNPNLYGRENVEYKIMPLKAALTSLFSVVGNGNPIFNAIWSNTFTKTQLPKFSSSYFPIIPLCRPFAEKVNDQIKIIAVNELIECIHTVSGFCISSGDIDSLSKYLPIALHIEKRLKFYLQEARGNVLVEKIVCETGAINLSALQEVLNIINLSHSKEEEVLFTRKHSNMLPIDISKIASLNEKAESVDAYDSTLKQENDDDLLVKKEPAELEDDEIDIQAVVIEGLDDIKTSKVMSSPTFKRKSPDKLPELVVLDHKTKCQCVLCSHFETVKFQFNVGVCLLSTFTAKNQLDNGVRMCNKMIASLAKAKGVTVGNFLISEDFETKILLVKCNLLLLQGKRTEAIKCLDKLKPNITNEAVNDSDVLARYNVLCCQIQGKPFNLSYKKSQVELDDIIDSAEGHLPLSPTSMKEPDIVPCTPLVKKPPIRSVKSSVKKPPKTPFSGKKQKGFDIYCDEPATDKKKTSMKKQLPKPDLYDFDNDDLVEEFKSISIVTPAPKTRKSRRRIVTAESSSDEEEDIIVPNRLKKSPPNIMKTRNAAVRRNRRRNGPVYTDKSPERTRGAVRETRRRGRTKVEKVNDDEDTTSAHISDFSIKQQNDHLMQALRTSITNDDAITSKQCLQLLSDVSYKSYQTTSIAENITEAIGYHALSIGVSYRGQSHYYMHKAQSSNGCENYGKWLKHAVQTTHPKHLLTSVTKPDDYLTQSQKYIPKHWTVCAISLVTNAGKNHLLLSRIQNNTTPLHIQLSDEVTGKILEEFDEILTDNAFTIKNIKDKSQWWTQRRNHNRDLKSLLRRIEAESLSFAKGLLLGKPIDKQRQIKLEKEASHVADIMGISNDPVKIELLKVVINSWYTLCASEKGQALQYLSDENVTKKQRLEACRYISNKFKNTGEMLQRHHVVLVLDKKIQFLPWENIEMLYKYPVTRMPSYDTLILQLKLMNTLDHSVAAKGVDMNTVSYILNPDKDLVATENRFRDWFGTAETWRGIVSRPPTSQEWIECITKYDLFIYTGHGSGSKFVHSNTISKLQGRAASFIIGCSSGALKEYGSFEPNGPVLSYLIAGVPCVLSCLWTVTDKDVDRFLAKIIATWACSPKREDNLAECMHIASSNCNMRWLNGAACVIYGLPVNCQVKMKKLLDSLPEELNLKKKTCE